MAALAKQRAIERFHPVAVARRHLTIYADTLARRTRSTATV
jgi:hypothetical protein